MSPDSLGTGGVPFFVLRSSISIATSSLRVCLSRSSSRGRLPSSLFGIHRRAESEEWHRVRQGLRRLLGLTACALTEVPTLACESKSDFTVVILGATVQFLCLLQVVSKFKDRFPYRYLRFFPRRNRHTSPVHRTPAAAQLQDATHTVQLTSRCEDPQTHKYYRSFPPTRAERLRPCGQSGGENQPGRSTPSTSPALAVGV